MVDTGPRVGMQVGLPLTEIVTSWHERKSAFSIIYFLEKYKIQIQIHISPGYELVMSPH